MICQEISSFRLEFRKVAARSQYFWFCKRHMGMMEGMGLCQYPVQRHNCNKEVKEESVGGLHK